MGNPAFCVTVENEWKTACSKPNLIFSTGLRIYKFSTFIFIIACPPPSPRSKRTGTIVLKDRGLNILNVILFQMEQILTVCALLLPSGGVNLKFYKIWFWYKIES